MSEHVIIGKRFNGPPNSGHGGYTCGIVAGLIGGIAEVTLRRPIPLDCPIEIRKLAGGVDLLEGETIVANGVVSRIEIDIPEPVTLEDARAASNSYLGFKKHPFPTCFVCGHHRAEGDGLRVFPGPVEKFNIFAAPWTPDSSIMDADGNVGPEFLWAVLDCPGGWVALSNLNSAAVLGRFAAKVVGAVSPNEHYVAMGWLIRQESKKIYAGSALFSRTSDLIAFASAIWIKVPSFSF